MSVNRNAEGVELRQQGIVTREFRVDEFEMFGRDVGVESFNDDADVRGNTTTETRFDLGAGVDWSRLRMLTTP